MGSNWYLGTMGFGYADWEGVFYPPGLPAHNYLRHYSKFFNSVELDTTFYGPPKVDQVLRWQQSVSETFLFSLKTPRQITHEHRLDRAQGLMEDFLLRLKNFKSQLGVVLIQLPPDFIFLEKSALFSFVSTLPDDFRFAVEFRHPSWFNDETRDILSRYQIGWAATEYLDLPVTIQPTSDFLYIRWIGDHGRYGRKDHERVDLTGRLQNWANLIQSQLKSVNTVFGYFNNDYAGFSPGTCNRFKKIVGLPTKNFQPPRQTTLF